MDAVSPVPPFDKEFLTLLDNPTSTSFKDTQTLVLLFFRTDIMKVIALALIAIGS